MISTNGDCFIKQIEVITNQLENADWNAHNNTIETDLFFSIEAGARAELNVFKFMRLNAGVSYRYVSGLELRNKSNDMMNNFKATVELKFGKF